MIAIIGGFVALVAGIWIKETKAENYIQMTEGYIYKPKDYTRQQKIHQGKIKKKDIRLANLLKESNRKVA